MYSTTSVTAVLRSPIVVSDEASDRCTIEGGWSPFDGRFGLR